MALSSLSAVCSQTSTSPGSHSIIAIYSGDTNFATSTSSTLTQIVNKGSTTTTITSSVNPSVLGQPVIFTATIAVVLPAIGTPTGSITFQDGGVNITGCVNAPSAVYPATCSQTYQSTGSHAITAIYSGDTNFVTSTSSTLTQVVNKSSTTTVVTSSVNPSVSGQSVTFTTTVSISGFVSGTTPTGTVNFKAGGTTITGCTVRALNGSAMATCHNKFQCQW